MSVSWIVSNSALHLFQILRMSSWGRTTIEGPFEASAPIVDFLSRSGVVQTVNVLASWSQRSNGVIACFSAPIFTHDWLSAPISTQYCWWKLIICFVIESYSTQLLIGILIWSIEGPVTLLAVPEIRDVLHFRALLVLSVKWLLMISSECVSVWFTDLFVHKVIVSILVSLVWKLVWCIFVGSRMLDFGLQYIVSSVGWLSLRECFNLRLTFTRQISCI